MESDAELRERAQPYWHDAMQLFARIDVSREPKEVELRKAMEGVIQWDVPLRERAPALIALLRPFDPAGTLH